MVTGLTFAHLALGSLGRVRADLSILSTAPFFTAICKCVRVIAKSGVLAPESSGDQIDLCYLNTVFELYSGYHLGQVIEAA
jgi:hypothetical protein